MGCLLLGSGRFAIGDRGYIKFFCGPVLERVMLGSGIQERSGYGGIAPPEKLSVRVVGWMGSFSKIFSYLNLMRAPGVNSDPFISWAGGE